MSFKGLQLRVVVLIIVAVGIFGCVDGAPLKEPPVDIEFSSCPPDCGRLPNPDEMYEIETVVDNQVRACGGAVWDDIADGLIYKLYTGDLYIFDEDEATDPNVLGYWVSDYGGASRIWISDWHWDQGTLDVDELAATLGHEGIHENDDSPYHDSSFWNQYNTCYAN